MDADIKKMLDGLDGMTKNLEAIVKKSFEQMNPEQAMEFAKGLENARVNEKVNEAHTSISELRKSFKID
jgi:hypothetical protein